MNYRPRTSILGTYICTTRIISPPIRYCCTGKMSYLPSPMSRRVHGQNIKLSQSRLITSTKMMTHVKARATMLRTCGPASRTTTSRRWVALCHGRQRTSAPPAPRPRSMIPTTQEQWQESVQQSHSGSRFFVFRHFNLKTEMKILTQMRKGTVKQLWQIATLCNTEFQIRDCLTLPRS